jgi:hypothetical protein
MATVNKDDTLDSKEMIRVSISMLRPFVVRSRAEKSRMWWLPTAIKSILKVWSSGLKREPLFATKPTNMALDSTWISGKLATPSILPVSKA